MRPSDPIRIFLSGIIALGLTATAVWWAPLNQDEGWYLLATRMVSRAQIPYRDFAFTQTPLFPYVFQLVQPGIEAFGMVAGRLFNVFWLLMTYWVLLWSCKKRVPASAYTFSVLTVLCLLGLNAFQTQYAVTIKTYTLAGYFLCLSVLGWLSYCQGGRSFTLILTAVGLALATATRITLVVFYIPFFLSLLSQRKVKGDKQWILFSLSSILSLCILLLPFVLANPQGFYYHVLEFHTQRIVRSPWLIKAGFIARVLMAYFPAFLCLFFVLRRYARWQPGTRSIAAGIALTTILHVCAAMPYDDYLAVLYPALVLLIAIELAFAVPKLDQQKAGRYLLCGCMAYMIASPQLPTWFAGKQDRIWISAKAHSDLAVLQHTAAEITEAAPTAQGLITTDAYLAIETNLEVPKGFEMGPFSYHPHLETTKANLYQVLNTEKIIETLNKKTYPLAALSGYGFNLQSPQITPTSPTRLKFINQAVSENYNPVSRVSPFGQHGSTLTIYRQKDHP